MIPAQEDDADELYVSTTAVSTVVGSSHRGATENGDGHLKDRHQLRQLSCRGIEPPKPKPSSPPNRQPAQDCEPELIKASRKSRGHYCPTRACCGSATRGSSTTNRTASLPVQTDRNRRSRRVRQG